MNFIFYFRPLLTIVLFVSSSLLLAQDFDLSRLPRVTNEGTIYDVYPTPDGKYIIVGNFDFIEDKPLERIARLNSDGTLDESFSTLPRWEDGILDVAISDSGEVFIALYIYANEGEHKVIKLKSDGSLDNDFIFNANQQVAVLGWNSGRLLAGGSFTKVNNTPTSRLVSITANGVLNSDFNANISIDHGIYDIGFQGEKIIISSQNGSLLKRLNSDGSTDQSFQYDYESLKLALGGNTLRYEMIVTTDSHIVIYDTFNGLIFLDADGVFINSKDNHRQITAMAVSNGVLYYTHALNENQYVFKYIIETEAYDYLGEAKGRTFSMAVSNDHSVLLGGRINEFRSVKTYSIAKLDASDNPNEDFGIRDFYQIGSIYTLGLQGNDKLIIGGYFTKVNGVSVSNLARLNLDGSLDMDFTPFDNGGNAISKIQVTGDNKFYAIGNVWSPSSGFYMPGLHLINADGSYNKTIYPESVRDFIILNDQIIAHNFGYAKSINLTTNETVDFIKGTGPDQYHTVVSSKNGNVLVSGLFRDPSGYYTTLNSYLPDGTLDPNFNQLTVTKEGNNPTMEALQIAADGKIWVGGKFDTVNGVPAPSDGLIRLHPDGTLDSSFNPNGEGLNDGRSSTINYIKYNE
ncbi:MAG: delta-60 repeat domain-containing protein [Cyclobacteriaceae bacterium]